MKYREKELPSLFSKSSEVEPLEAPTSRIAGVFPAQNSAIRSSVIGCLCRRVVRHVLPILIEETAISKVAVVAKPQIGLGSAWLRLPLLRDVSLMGIRIGT